MAKRWIQGALAAGVALMTVTAVSVTASYAAAGGGGCQLDGTATFTPNGPGTSDTFGYSFGGTLSSCQSNVAAAPATYTISTTSTVFPVGNGAQGVLTFQVADPTQCNTAGGVSQAAIGGIVGVGSTS